MQTTLTHIGTATMLVQFGGLTFLTDPVFDPAPTEYVSGPVVLRSTTEPAIAASDLPPFDAVLLSHDEHPDNLDEAGRRLLEGKPVMTTESGAGRLGGQSVGIAPWSSHTLTVGEKSVNITAMPAHHGPAGDVVGFILQAPGEEKVLYISGDTTYETDLDQIGEKFTIGVAVLHLGAAKFAILGDQMISMDSANAAKFTASLGAHTVVPIHFSSWEHFTETEDEIAASFAEAGLTDRLQWLTPGMPRVVEI
ncbi:MBL fold metallo-hydrolase [Arthrobacter sp. AL08]|uniref:MBL fold metallo-hydrolase n=1 Tax=unclassified Arthrobacter TaxID=235627 RepID=UPI00249AD378|nr:MULTISPECIES: MBL fold metallo-hydrolase [unclassified Arthrobacter]MDI3243416.1 MBL fold metallo-hydrolase [Arthrobacter sp. AL05]MDI3279431.1 MBL fold metallo-hydrolase [Arthrobacter sp. AL08]